MGGGGACDIHPLIWYVIVIENRPVCSFHENGSGDTRNSVNVLDIVRKYPPARVSIEAFPYSRSSTASKGHVMQQYPRVNEILC